MVAESGAVNSRTGTVMGRELPPSRHRDRGRGREVTRGGDTQWPVTPRHVLHLHRAAPRLAPHAGHRHAPGPAPCCNCGGARSCAGEASVVLCTVSARSIQYDDCRAVLCPRSIQLSLIHSFNYRKETPTPSWPSCHSPWRCSTPSSTSSLP